MENLKSQYKIKTIGLSALNGKLESWVMPGQSITKYRITKHETESATKKIEVATSSITGGKGKEKTIKIRKKRK